MSKFLDLIQKQRNNQNLGLCPILNGNVFFWRPRAPKSCIFKIQKPQHGFVNHPSPIFAATPSFFAIFGPEMGQINKKKLKKIDKIAFW